MTRFSLKGNKLLFCGYIWMMLTGMLLLLCCWWLLSCSCRVWMDRTRTDKRDFSLDQLIDKKTKKRKEKKRKEKKRKEKKRKEKELTQEMLGRTLFLVAVELSDLSGVDRLTSAAASGSWSTHDIRNASPTRLFSCSAYSKQTKKKIQYGNNSETHARIDRLSVCVHFWGVLFLSNLAVDLVVGSG